MMKITQLKSKRILIYFLSLWNLSDEMGKHNLNILKSRRTAKTRKWDKIHYKRWKTANLLTVLFKIQFSSPSRAGAVSSDRPVRPPIYLCTFWSLVPFSRIFFWGTSWWTTSMSSCCSTLVWYLTSWPRSLAGGSYAE